MLCWKTIFRFKVQWAKQNIIQEDTLEQFSRKIILGQKVRYEPKE